MIHTYAWASTDSQTVDAQVRQSRAACAAKVCRKTASAAKTDRAQLRCMLKQREPIDRRNAGKKTLGEIAHSYNVSRWMISRLAQSSRGNS